MMFCARPGASFLIFSERALPSSRPALLNTAKLAAAIWILIALQACGGGANSGAQSSSGDQINGVSVPPEPDMTANEATLKGVDANSNNVRDDVERAMVKITTYSASRDEPVAQAYTRLSSEINISASDAGRLYKFITCSYAAQPLTIDVENAILNSDQRRNIFQESVAKAMTTGEISASFSSEDCK